MPEFRGVFPQGERFGAGEDGFARGAALCDPRQCHVVVQDFGQDVGVLHNPCRNIGVVQPAFENGFVVGEPDVAVDGGGHFAQFEGEVG